jgi:hypothetical protein
LNNLKKIAVLIRTLKHLKPIQIKFQFINRLKKAKPLSSYFLKVCGFSRIKFFEISEPFVCLKMNNLNEYDFFFLNLSKNFKDSIDWNFFEYGKLWNYNLQYLDFLKQTNISSTKKFNIIESCYENLINSKLRLEPYPASLRIMNMIRFVSTEKITEDQIVKCNKYILAEAEYLHQNLEYHILANHLLENLFAMHMSAMYFENSERQLIYQKLITEQLDEQILKDGAHFELSPMYHKIILFRMFELYQYIQNKTDFFIYIENKLSAMLSWLNYISFSDGNVPHFNDSTQGIIYSNTYFFKTAKNFNLNMPNIKLKDSGYRKFEKNDFEMVLDVNGISPSYQPGHAHADTFSFCLHFNGKPIIVDVGISTYNISSRRNWERSTEAHNTISINSENSAEVWSGFRVGRRLNVKISKDEKEHLIARHNGYNYLGISIERTILFNENIQIIDKCSGDIKYERKFNLHFHPDNTLEMKENSIIINNKLIFNFTGLKKIEIIDYEYCIGYNQLKNAKKVQITFNSEKLITSIQKL